MNEIRLIEKETDISQLKMYKYNWDVEIAGQPFQVVKIEGYVHTIGGIGGFNDLWMYPRDEEPTYENLIEYRCTDMGVCWGIKYAPKNYTRNKWGECECFTSGGAMITRNDKDFFFCRGGIREAEYLLPRIYEHPIGLNEIDYDKKIIGKKVWWRSEPGIITSWVGNGQACVIIEPDGIKKFTVPAEHAEDGDDYYEDNSVKVDIFSNHIWWFRN